MKPSAFETAFKFVGIFSLSVPLLFSACATQKASPTSQLEFSEFTEARSVIVQKISGNVEVASEGGQPWQPAQASQQLEAGQSIRTGADSTAELYIPDVGPMLLTPNSTLIINSIKVNKTVSPPFVKAEFDLPQGRVIGETLKMSSDSAVTIKTPKGRHLIK
ncbi:MAG: hypothetical protein ACO1QB_16985 [Verrucomicrobiales bacterium]